MATTTFLQIRKDHFSADNGMYSTPLGSTKNTGTPDIPVRRKVRLHDQPTGRLLRQTWSAQGTGAYQFFGLSEGSYYVVSFDHTGLYNGEIMTDIILPATVA